MIEKTKHCCQGMGANKNEDAMVRTSKAAVVLTKSVKKLEESLNIKDNSRGSHHKDETEDRAMLALRDSRDLCVCNAYVKHTYAEHYPCEIIN